MDDLGPYVTRVGAALADFLDADHGDAMVRYAQWSSALSGPLPVVGAGGDAVIEELLRDVVPNGTRIHEPEFWGWIAAYAERSTGRRLPGRHGRLTPALHHDGV